MPQILSFTIAPEAAPALITAPKAKHSPGYYARRKRKRNRDRKRFPNRFKERAAKYGAVYQRVDRFKVYERDNYLCYLCQLPVSQEVHGDHPQAPSIDHIVPLSLGGSHTFDNCATAHRSCNLRKGSLLLDQLNISIVVNEFERSADAVLLPAV